MVRGLSELLQNGYNIVFIVLKSTGPIFYSAINYSVVWYILRNLMSKPLSVWHVSQWENRR